MSGVVHGLLASFAGVVRDTFFRYVSLLLNTSATNGAQNNTFLDSSTNAFSITRNGNTTQGNFSPFSQTGWSNYFDGTGDFLTAPDNAALNMGTSDFTLEAWIYLTATPGVASPGGAMIINKDGQNAVSWAQYHLAVTSGLKAVFASSAVPNAGVAPTAVITGATTLALNTWYHVAVTRIGANATLWVNGVSDGTTASVPANLTNGARPLYSGYENGQAATYYFPGYISNLRIVKGTAVYTSNFTPPTSPLTNITNTSLLTCQSNRFIDNSSNAFAITRNGDVRVEAFSPFAPTAAWSASTNGGSGYFDGTGDYLSAASNAAFDILSGGDFTVECWFYANSLSDNAGFGCALVSREGSLGLTGFIFRVKPDRLEFVYPGLSGNVQLFTFVTNTWYHVAAVRSSGTMRYYINGTQYSPTYTDRTTDATVSLLVGASGFSGNSAPFTGYISNARIVKGTAVYTANFTPPTAPLTAITNTSLLLNFTNAGIYDSASGNDLETVGNAQVSTVQSKWGTTSMAFDGTGDWLVQIDRPALRLGTAAFTIEMWVYRSASGTYGLISKGTSTTGWSVSLNASNQVVFSFAASSFNSTGAVAATTWTHIAVVREGTGASQTKIYINGTNDGTGTVATDFSGTDVMYVGADRVAGSNFNGYIDDLRITNGVARYTSNFTAPTAAFPLQ